MENVLNTSANSVPSFDLDDFNSVDTAEMTIVANGKPTAWKWIFAGPGHQKAIDYNNARSRERLHEERMQQQSLLNGKKVKLPEETPDEVRARNVNSVVARLIGWTPVIIGGAPFEFSEENARKFLSDPSRTSIFLNALEFLNDDASFTKRKPEI